MHLNRASVIDVQGIKSIPGHDAQRISAGMMKSPTLDGGRPKQNRPHHDFASAIGADLQPHRRLVQEEALASDPRPVVVGASSIGRRVKEQQRPRGAQYLPQILQSANERPRGMSPPSLSASTPDLGIDGLFNAPGSAPIRTPPMRRQRGGGSGQAPLRTPPRGFGDQRGSLCLGDGLPGGADAPFEAPELSIGNPSSEKSQSFGRKRASVGYGASGMRPSFAPTPQSLAMAASAFELVNQVQRHSTAEEIACAAPVIIKCSPQVARPGGHNPAPGPRQNSR